jgi:hypothetical protein
MIRISLAQLVDQNIFSDLLKIKIRLQFNNRRRIGYFKRD